MKQTLRRIFIFSLSLGAIITAALIVVPLVVNVDHYRPALLQKAAPYLNGKLSIAKLSLSLWGELALTAEAVELRDEAGELLLSAQVAKIRVPLPALWNGQPLVVISLAEPQLQLKRDASGRLNLAQALRTDSTASADPASSAPAEAEPLPTLSESAESWLRRASLDLEVTGAHLSFNDLASGVQQDFSGLDLHLEDLSMTQAMRLSATLRLVSDSKNGLHAEGPLSLKGRVQPEFKGLAWQHFALDFELNASDLALNMPEVLAKSAGQRAELSVSASLSHTELSVEAATLRLLDSVIQAKGALKKLDQPIPVLSDLQITSDAVQLASWESVILPLRGQALAGTLSIKASAHGPLDHLDYRADLKGSELSANIPGLALRPVASFSALLVPDNLKDLQLRIKARENQLLLALSMANFAAPHLQVRLSSPGLNLDDLLPPAAPAANAASTTDKGASLSNAPAQDFDKLLDPLRDNPYLAKIVATMTVDIATVQARGMRVAPLKMQLGLRNLVANIQTLEAGMLNGMARASGSLDIKPAEAHYQLTAELKELDLSQAHFGPLASFSQSLQGRLSMKASGSGNSLNSDKALSRLQLSGSFALRDARFASIDVTKIAIDGLNSAAGKLKAVIPGFSAESSRLESRLQKASRYRLIASSFALNDGVLRLPDFHADSYPGEGIDVLGATEVGLLSDDLKADWDVVDTYDATGARSLSLSVGGQTIPAILAEGNAPIRFPIKLGCKLSAPCFDYMAVASALSQVALSNIKNRATATLSAVQAEAEAMLKAEEERLINEAKLRLEAEKKKLSDGLEDKVRRAADDLRKKHKLPF